MIPDIALALGCKLRCLTKKPQLRKMDHLTVLSKHVGSGKKRFWLKQTRRTERILKKATRSLEMHNIATAAIVEPTHS